MFVADNKTSSVEFEGSIEVDEQTFNECRDAQLNGRGFGVRDGEVRIWSETNRTVYKTSDRTSLDIPENEDTPEGYTSLVPEQGQVWSDREWVTPPPNESQIIDAVKSHVQSVSASKGYDSPEALQSYANSTVSLWRAEAAAFSMWRDTCWQYVYEQIALWENEERTIDTADQLVSELDEIVWPTESDYVPALVKQSVLSNLIVDGQIAENIVASSGVAAAWRQSTGIYWIFFAAAEPDTNYIVNSYDGGAVRVYAPSEEKSTTYCIIRVEDETGNLTDPTQVNIEIKRAI
tara:strand:+ start:23999 stop:24871 length:873 start_codon:yes stop_codon:yes gene_type:complete